MFRYFGFGSNMNIVSLRAKGVEPLRSRPATLPGWHLRFNVEHFFRHEGGVGNIEPSQTPGNKVLGMLHDCADEALDSLDAMEAYGHGYDRIQVEVEADGQSLPAYTYVGMPNFINDQCLPSRRYLNIVIEGAKQSGLDGDYIKMLESQAVLPRNDHPMFTPPAGNFPVFDRNTLPLHPLYTALYGAVFDMTDARPQHEYLKRFFDGRDMTLFHLKRMDSSDGSETMEDIRHGRINKAQLQYLNGYLNEYAKEYQYVGRFEFSNEQ